jgi:hypothetical protein
MAMKTRSAGTPSRPEVLLAITLSSSRAAVTRRMVPCA